jgi:hypothetical protein
MAASRLSPLSIMTFQQALAYIRRDYPAAFVGLTARQGNDYDSPNRWTSSPAVKDNSAPPVPGGDSSTLASAPTPSGTDTCSSAADPKADPPGPNHRAGFRVRLKGNPCRLARQVNQIC